ncbi:MAG: hypothetical protein NZ529_05400 [Cytophagaceae bacterium]|nr:hypothetical protein [Cytophagaceae bacterium]MDW8456213.1 hypothetical protein [Cytophagaceae bacterium]
MSNFDEIHKILKRLAKSQIKTDRQIAELRLAQEKTDKQIAELRMAQEKTDAQLAKTDAQLAQTDAQLAKTDAQLAKTDAQLAQTDAKLKEASAILSNIGINLGFSTEDLFFNTFKKKPVLAGTHYDEVLRHVCKRSGNLQDEFDMLLINGDSVALIEIKHRVHPNDVDVLINKKLKNFRELYPVYKGHKVYLGLAGMSFPEVAEEKAKEAGIAILRQVGEVAEVDAENLKAY